jgi:hypothetical protein
MDKKRKFESKKVFHQEEAQKTQHPAYSGSKNRSVVPYKVPTASFKQPSQSVPAKTQGINHTQAAGGSQLTNLKACFNYRETWHFIANCPYKNKPTPSIFSNSVNGPKQASAARRGAPAKSQQSFRKAKVNHIYAE